jgi:5-methylcytosine-specific restriction enzyme A
MPRALRVCAHPGCPEIAVVGSYCPAHSVTSKREYVDNRPSPSRRGYDRAWEKLRDRYLREHPVCEVCGSDDHVQVDHIIPISQGGARLDWDNLQTLCRSHHSHKTATVDRRRARGA